MKIFPQDDLILVRYMEKKNITPQGIEIPESVKADLVFAEVIEVGQGAPTQNGSRVPHSVKPKDIVMLSSRGACFPVEYGNIFATKSKGMPRLALVPRDSVMAVVILENGETLGNPVKTATPSESLLVGAEA